MKSKLITMICLVFSIFLSRAQTGSYSFWYEYGNGNFITTSFADNLSMNTYMNSTTNFPVVINGGGTEGLKKITPVYKPGEANILKVRLTNSPSSSFPKTTLSGANNLKVYTSTSDFLSNDTVLLALQYKPINSAKKLVFFYNSNLNNSAFKVISSSTPLLTLPTENSSPTTINSRVIRTHYGEVLNTTTNPVVLNTIGRDFTNNLVFNIQSTPFNQKTIFLTLISLTNIPLQNNESFKLVLLDSTDHMISEQTNQIVNHSRLKSHDPNFEQVEPSCIEFHTGGGSTVKYHVHFQNTGPGAADSVKTYTALPIGYTMSDISNLRSEIAKQASSLYYNVNTSRSHDDTLIIEFRKQTTSSTSTRSVLLGTNGLSNPLENIATMGDFYFDLKLKNLLPGPDNLVSKTSIYFDDNEVVNTNECVVRIRKCCDCKEDPNNNPRHGHQSCNCKTLRRFWRWLFCKDC